MQKLYKCPRDDCSWKFSCASKLRRHLDSHSKQKNHACPECGTRFKTWYNVLYHVRTIHHGNEKPFKCPVRLCEITCTSAVQLHRHFHIDHLNLTLFCCSSDGCYASFLSKDEYLVHQFTHKKATGTVTVELFTCDFCKAVLPTKSKLRRHRMFHIGEKHFKCPIKNCGHAYFTKQHLSRHLEQGDHLKGAIVNCYKCSRTFLDNSILEHHSMVHDSSGGFTCLFKGCDGMTLPDEDDYHSHLISTHVDTSWLPCTVMKTEKCKLFFPNKELLNLHQLLYHRYSTQTLKHLSIVLYSKSTVRNSTLLTGSRDDLAVVRLIVRLYPYLRSFHVPFFDPYLAAITLFNNAGMTCSELDGILRSLSLSEIDAKAVIACDSRQEVQANVSISSNVCLQTSSLTNVPLQVTSQTETENQALVNVEAANILCSTTEDVPQVATSTTASSTQRPLLLSMPLLTDLQPTNDTDQLGNDTAETNNTEMTSSNVLHSSADTILPETSTNREEYDNTILLAGHSMNNSMYDDSLNEVFDMSVFSSAGNECGSSFDADSLALLPDDILDLANDPACVRDLMESAKLNILLPSDFLEPSTTDWTSLSLPDIDSSTGSSSDVPNFSQLSNPLADLTFESLSSIPDSIIESTLQMLIENCHTSSDDPTCDMCSISSTPAVDGNLNSNTKMESSGSNNISSSVV